MVTHSNKCRPPAFKHSFGHHPPTTSCDNAGESLAFGVGVRDPHPVWDVVVVVCVGDSDEFIRSVRTSSAAFAALGFCISCGGEGPGLLDFQDFLGCGWSG